MLTKDIVSTLEQNGFKLVEKVEYYDEVKDMYTLFF